MGTSLKGKSLFPLGANSFLSNSPLWYGKTLLPYYLISLEFVQFSRVYLREVIGIQNDVHFLDIMKKTIYNYSRCSTLFYIITVSPNITSYVYHPTAIHLHVLYIMDPYIVHLDSPHQVIYTKLPFQSPKKRLIFY